MNIDQITIKPTSRSTILTHIESNDVFRKIIKDTNQISVSTYDVNNSICRGLTFEDLDNFTISNLKKFCNLALLEVIFIDVPWRENVTVAFIRKAVDRWNKSALNKITCDQFFNHSTI